MEKSPEQKKLSKWEYPSERIIGPGFDEEDFAIARDHMRGRFEKQEFMADLEREMTGDEKFVADLANNETNRLCERYGIPGLDIGMRNIHFISKEKWPERLKNVNAVHDVSAQSILCREQYDLSYLAKVLYHDELHLKSHQAARHVEEGGKHFFNWYRYGLGLSSAKRDGGELLFARFNEAVIERLSMEFYEKTVRQDPFFKEYIDRRDQAAENFRANKEQEARERSMAPEDIETLADEVAGVTVDPSGEELEFSFFSYPRDRAALQLLIKKIAQRTNVTEEEKIFDLFARGVVRGNIKDLGAIIDRAFGPGIFARLGEMSTLKHAPDELIDFVKSL